MLLKKAKKNLYVSLIVFLTFTPLLGNGRSQKQLWKPGDWIRTSRVRGHHFIFPRLLCSSFTSRSWTLLLPPCDTCPTFSICTTMERKKQWREGGGSSGGWGRGAPPLLECLHRRKNSVLSFGFDLWRLAISTLSGVDLKRKQRRGNCICLPPLCLFNSLHDYNHEEDDGVPTPCTVHFSQSQTGTVLTSPQPLTATGRLWNYGSFFSLTLKCWTLHLF